MSVTSPSRCLRGTGTSSWGRKSVDSCSVPVCDFKVSVDLAESKVVVEWHDAYYDTSDKIEYLVGPTGLADGDLVDGIVWFLLNEATNEFIEKKKALGSYSEDGTEALLLGECA